MARGTRGHAGRTRFRIDQQLLGIDVNQHGNSAEPDSQPPRWR